MDLGPLLCKIHNMTNYKLYLHREASAYAAC